MVDKASRKMHLKDPYLLSAGYSKAEENNIDMLVQHYPSPEKLYAAYESKLQTVDDYFSNLFSIGLIGIELNKMDFVDGAYAGKR